MTFNKKMPVIWQNPPKNMTCSEIFDKRITTLQNPVNKGSLNAVALTKQHLQSIALISPDNHLNDGQTD